MFTMVLGSKSIQTFNGSDFQKSIPLLRLIMIEIFLNVIIDFDYSNGKSDYTLYCENNMYILDFNELHIKFKETD